MAVARLRSGRLSTVHRRVLAELSEEPSPAGWSTSHASTPYGKHTCLQPSKNHLNLHLFPWRIAPPSTPPRPHFPPPQASPHLAHSLSLAASLSGDYG